MRKEAEPVERSAEEIEENLLDSDSVDNTNCSNSCAESEIVEEQSIVNDEPHYDVADNSDAINHDLDVWNYVMSYVAEAYGVPTKTDESGAVILVRDENVFTRKPDVSTDKLETCVSSDSESHTDGSDNYSSVPETSDDTSETHEEGSSDEPDSQVADSGTSDNERSTSENSECAKYSDLSSATPEESQTVSNIDCSSHEKPESADVKDSEVDEAEEKIFAESISEETNGISKIEEKRSIDINSSVDSNDETEEEIFVETISTKTPENMVSEEKESVEVNSTDNSTFDPKRSDSEESVSNETKSPESVPSKKKRSRKNRRPRKKKVRKENLSLGQTEPKLKGKAVDTCSCVDNWHIARNCVNRPFVPHYSSNTHHQKAIHYRSDGNRFSQAKPSDGDWNLAKRNHQRFSNTNGFQRQQMELKVSSVKKNVSNNITDSKIWKPTVLAGSQSHCSQPSTSTSSPQTSNSTKNYMIFREVSYTDSDGQLRSTMAWVPVSN
ncbi:acidic repeat-containing protein-like [Helianthus annuus]|uniref:acidic repeat-containing protein-like n=1 Tax=Helianthus annuus TaxID=4232 RepID=UPI000B8FFF07|nr:acidic repeat-containing protein-like [Helianthus annuus]